MPSARISAQRFAPRPPPLQAFKANSWTPSTQVESTADVHFFVHPIGRLFVVPHVAQNHSCCASGIRDRRQAHDGRQNGAAAAKANIPMEATPSATIASADKSPCQAAPTTNLAPRLQCENSSIICAHYTRKSVKAKSTQWLGEDFLVDILHAWDFQLLRRLGDDGGQRASSFASSHNALA